MLLHCVNSRNSLVSRNCFRLWYFADIVLFVIKEDQSALERCFKSLSVGWYSFLGEFVALAKHNTPSLFMTLLGWALLHLGRIALSWLGIPFNISPLSFWNIHANYCTETQYKEELLSCSPVHGIIVVCVIMISKNSQNCFQWVLGGGGLAV